MGGRGGGQRSSHEKGTRSQALRRRSRLRPPPWCSPPAPAAAAGAAPTADADFSAKPTGTLNAWAFENADDVGSGAPGLRRGAAGRGRRSSWIRRRSTPRSSRPAWPAATCPTSCRWTGDTYDLRGAESDHAARPVLRRQEVDPDERWYQFVVDDVRFDDKVWAVPQFYQPPAILLNTRRSWTRGGHPGTDRHLEAGRAGRRDRQDVQGERRRPDRPRVRPRGDRSGRALGARPWAGS